MSDPIVPPVKRCTKCGEEKTATSEFWTKEKHGKYGLKSTCKICARAYRQANAKRISDYGYANRARRKEYHQEYSRAWRLRNAERLYKKYRKHYLENKEQIGKRNRAYNRSHPEVTRAGCHRHFARKKSLPATLTKEQWQNAIEYFKGRCAVCGRPLKDLFGTHTISADHWVPISSPDCPGTVVENMVPLCHGLGGCNNSKNDKRPEDWLKGQYGKRKAEQILQRINAYFEWAMGQE